MTASAWESLFGPDPGRLRLWMAARVVVTAALTLTALLLLQYRKTVPFDAIGLGLMVSLFSSAVVRDPGPAQQRMTLLTIPLPALGAWTAAAFLNRWPWAADIGFVAVVFSASLARLEGPRGMALGMVAYLSYFISDVTRSQPSHYPVIMLAVALAITGAYLSRFHLIPHDPAAALNRLLRHLRNRVRRVLSDISATSLSGDGERSDPARLGHQLARVREAAILAKEQIDALAKEGNLDRVRQRVAIHLLGVELGIERLVRLPLSRALSIAQRVYLCNRLSSLQQLLAGSRSKIDRPSPPVCSDGLRDALDLLEGRFRLCRRAYAARQRPRIAFSLGLTALAKTNPAAADQLVRSRPIKSRILSGC